MKRIMSESGATFVMILLFALRCVVPLVLTILIGWLMNRLVDKWEAEEAVRVFHHCEVTDCPAYENTAVPCWQTKITSSGQLPAKCETCPIYTQSAPAV